MFGEDELDRFIIKQHLMQIFTKKKMNVWELAREYNWKDKKKFETNGQSWRFYRNKYKFINNRINSLVRKGVLSVLPNSNGNIYTSYICLDSFYKKVKIKNKFYECIFVLDLDKKWYIYQI